MRKEKRETETQRERNVECRRQTRATLNSFALFLFGVYSRVFPFFCTLIYAKELSYIIPGLLVSEIEAIEDLTVKHFESDDEEMDTRGRRAWTG